MELPLLIKALILGVVEELIEFPPVSLTGHLIIAGDPGYRLVLPRLCWPFVGRHNFTAFALYPGSLGLLVLA